MDYFIGRRGLRITAFLFTLFCSCAMDEAADHRLQRECIIDIVQPVYPSSRQVTISWSATGYQCPYFYEDVEWRLSHKIAAADLCHDERSPSAQWNYTPTSHLTSRETYRNSYGYMFYHHRHYGNGTLTHLNPLTTYEVKVTLSNPQTESSIIFVNTMAEYDAPGRIALNSIRKAEGKQVRWDPVSNVNGFEAYEVRLMKNNIPQTCIQINNAWNTTVTFHDVIPCVSYLFRVRVRKSRQNVGYWEEKDMEFERNGIMQVLANATSSTTATVSWTLAEPCNGLFWRLHYRVVCPEEQGTDVIWQQTTETAITTETSYSAELQHLEPFTKYDIAVILVRQISQISQMWSNVSASPIVSVTTLLPKFDSTPVVRVERQTVHLNWFYKSSTIRCTSYSSYLEWRASINVTGSRESCEAIQRTYLYTIPFDYNSTSFYGLSPLTSYRASVQLEKWNGGNLITVSESPSVTFTTPASDQILKIDYYSIQKAAGKSVTWNPLPCENMNFHFERYEAELLQIWQVVSRVYIRDPQNTTAYFHQAQTCTRYNFRVRIVTEEGLAGQFTFKTVQFQPDIIVSANATSSSSVSIAWSMVRPCNPTSLYSSIHYKRQICILQYEGNWQKTSRRQYNRTSFTEMVETTLTNLDGDTTYVISVVIESFSGWNWIQEQKSDTISVTTFPLVTVEPSADETNSLLVQWSLAPTCLGTYRVSYQLLQYLACPHHPVSEAPQIATEGLQDQSFRLNRNILTIQNLTNFASYNITVEKISRGGGVIASISRENTTRSNIPQPIEGNFSIYGRNVSWSPVTCEEIRGKFEYYEVQLRRENQERSEDIVETTVYEQQNPAVSFHAALPCTNYSLAVRVMNTVGASDWTEIDIGWDAVSVTSLDANTISAESVNVVWSATPGASECFSYRYKLEYRVIRKATCVEFSFSSEIEQRFFDISESSATNLTNLETNSTYNITVTIINGWNRTVSARSINITTLPACSNNGSAVSFPGGLLVQWCLAPSCPGIYQVTSRLIHRKSCPLTSLHHSAEEAYVIRNSTFIRLSLKEPFAKYKITINKVFKKSAFATAEIFWETALAAPTSAPVNVQVTGITENTITFEWEKPPCNRRNGPISHYEYNLTTPNRGDAINRSGVPMAVTDEKVMIKDLHPDTQYMFTVRACNEGLVGQMSEPVSTRTNVTNLNRVQGSRYTTAVSLVAALLILCLWVFFFIIYCRRRKPKSFTSATTTGAATHTGCGSGDSDMNLRGRAHCEELEMPHVKSWKHEKLQPACFAASSSNGSNDNDDVDRYDEINQGALIYENVLQDKLQRPAIPTDRLAEYMTNINSRGVTGFQDEFEIFQLEVTYPTDVANKKENQKKNRFLNVLPYDHSRVKLNLRGKDPNSDYINASWIHGYDAPKKYIAAQGPAVASINDFWRMIWKYGCKRVIMLTNLVEGKKRKCEQYWPDESCSYGEIYVAAKSKEVTKNYTIRRFDIDMAGVHRELVQFHYTAWPDMGVPEQPSQLMNFIEVTREGEGASKSPIIVHCSAGVGRTGTFITLDAMVDQMNAEGAVGIFNFVAGMRQHRAKMVQVVEQYQFIYATLLEALTCGDTSIPKVDFVRRYRALKTPSPDTGVTSLQEEFELLRSYTVIPGEDEVSAATREENLSKNRYRNKVPPDRVRPYLMTEVEGGTNYINATYFPGRKTRNQYITTQSPLPNTAVDFWRLVVDYKVTRIMMLHGDTPDETFAKYWSEDDELICGPFVVTSAKEVIVPGIVERTLTVRKQTSKRPSQTVYQLQLECSIVEDDGLPSASDMIFMRTRLKSWPTHGHDSSPILVHCRDGVGTSATFCAFLTIMDKADCSEDVEIFQVCKKMRAVRPEAISHMKEYQLLYDVLQEYISSFEIYENCRG